MVAPDEQYRLAGDVLANWSRVLIFTHERPDGDAVGCVIALARTLQQQGKQAGAVLYDLQVERYERLLSYAPVVLWQDIAHQPLSDRCDGVVIVDTCAVSQLAPIAGLLESRTPPRLVIDHHVTRDDIADHYVIDERASSASLIVLEMVCELGWGVDRMTAEALFTGMATDTGWFRFSNTDARTLGMAARLLEHDVEPAQLFQTYYMSDSPARLHLMGLMLSGMKLHARDRLAVGAITLDMMARCGATNSDTQDLVNEMLKIGTVDAAILFTETHDGVVRVNLRSKDHLNCAALAARLGGGGHERAAGVRLPGSLLQATDQVVQAVITELTGNQ